MAPGSVHPPLYSGQKPHGADAALARSDSDRSSLRKKTRHLFDTRHRLTSKPKVSIVEVDSTERGYQHEPTHLSHPVELPLRPHEHISSQAKVALTFLDLPKRLRQLVYRSIDITERTLDIEIPGRGNSQISLSYTYWSLPVSLLATSRRVHDEAQPFFDLKKQQLRRCRPCIDICHTQLAEISNNPVLLDIIMYGIQVVRDNPYISCSTLTEELCGVRDALADGFDGSMHLPSEQVAATIPLIRQSALYLISSAYTHAVQNLAAFEIRITVLTGEPLALSSTHQSLYLLRNKCVRHGVRIALNIQPEPTSAPSQTAGLFATRCFRTAVIVFINSWMQGDMIELMEDAM